MPPTTSWNAATTPPTTPPPAPATRCCCCAPTAIGSPRSPSCPAAAPTRSAGSSSATWLVGPTRCRTGPTWGSRPTTRSAGSKSWSGSPTWIRTRWGSTVRCGRVGCWPTTWPRSPAIGRGSRRSGSRCTGPGLCASGPAGCFTARPGPAGVGKKRVRVEALLGAAASPVPPPAHTLIPDATLAEDLFPEDLPRLLGLLGGADLYLQDEVEVALHPTLTRVWSRAGRPGQRLVQAPGTNRKQYGFRLVDWRDGRLDFELADGRRAAPLCAQLRRAVARSRARGKIAMVILDNLSIHTPKGSRLLRGLLERSAKTWCWSTPPPMTRMPTGSSGCGAACAAPPPTPTGARRWWTWWPTLTGGRTPSLQPRCCRRSAARSRPTSTRLSERYSTMQHELPGSIFRGLLK